MSQENLIKLESVGGPNGAGKGHIIRTNKNKKNTPARLEVKKYNPIAKAHTIYKETK